MKIISKSLDLDENKINLNSEIEDLTRDSIQLFELVIALEKEFGYQAKYEDLIKIITVGDIIEYIKKIEK
ncbi:MAG: phosphopantetheine-binding protein [Candidatus Portnoybacteria bacterium]|nr:phosphopantetheine-binding protein [Candidatus Portnoybacteria bacterium]